MQTKTRDIDLMRRVTTDPEVLGGAPAIAGTRIPVSLILNLLRNGYSMDQVVEDHPPLTDLDIQAALTFAEAHVRALEPDDDTPSYRDRITIDPLTLLGTPTITGTRISVAMILGWIARGSTPEQIVADYPWLITDDVEAAVHFAAAYFDRLRAIPLQPLD